MYMSARRTAWGRACLRGRWLLSSRLRRKKHGNLILDPSICFNSGRRSNGELSDWAGRRGGQEDLCRTEEPSDRGKDISRAGTGERTGVVDVRQWSGPADRRVTLPVPCLQRCVVERRQAE